MTIFDACMRTGQISESPSSTTVFHRSRSLLVTWSCRPLVYAAPGPIEWLHDPEMPTFWSILLGRILHDKPNQKKAKRTTKTKTTTILEYLISANVIAGGDWKQVINVQKLSNVRQVTDHKHWLPNRLFLRNEVAPNWQQSRAQRRNDSSTVWSAINTDSFLKIDCKAREILCPSEEASKQGKRGCNRG